MAKIKDFYARLRQVKNWKLKVALTVFIFMVVFIHAFKFSFGFFFVNYTSSAPEGIYINHFWEGWKKGDYVILQIPFAMNRSSKGSYFLKKVAGLPGDSYDVLSDSLVINGKSYPINRSMKTLPQQAVGHYVVPDGRVLFLNDPDDSFDSRYFGTMFDKIILCKTSLLVSFDTLQAYWRKLPSSVQVYAKELQEKDLEKERRRKEREKELRGE